MIGLNGCLSTDPSNCTVNRGGTFDKLKSSSWITKANYALGAEGNLGYTTNSDSGAYGFDTIGIGKPGAGNVSVDGQVVAGILTPDFYTGNLGLASRPIVLGTDNDLHPSFLSSLQNRSMIPSLAYGFTAGASYRKLQAHELDPFLTLAHTGNADASLTLGGYDASRSTLNNVSFSFATAPTRQLVVGLKSISYSDSNNKNSPLLQKGILTLVDSLTPQIWLPLDACQSFEKAFGIVYDEVSNLYLVNQTVHDRLAQQNASITFELSNNPNGGPSVQVTLPYASFDLEIGGPPLAKEASKYFPLRRAADENQYTLGRTFLQEALVIRYRSIECKLKFTRYLVVNYETSEFTISQSLYSQSTPPHIIPILSTNSTTTDSTSTPAPKQPQVSVSTGHGSQSIGTGAIAGIVVGIVLIALVCGALVFYCRPSRRRRKGSVEVPAYPTSPRNAAEVEGSHFTNALGEKFIDITQVETDCPMTPPDEIDDRALFPPGREAASKYELSAEVISPSELESPNPDLPSPCNEFPTSELAAQGTAQRRSGLSSLDREPMRSRITASRLSSSMTEWASSGKPSPESDLISPASPMSGLERPVPIHRPGYQRMDSSEAESASSSMPRRPVPRPHQRTDSFESESGRTGDGMPSSPLHNRADSSSSGPWRMLGRRSIHGRLGSKDSIDSMGARMEQASLSGTYYGPSRAQASPSPLLESANYEEARSAMSSPDMSSDRSALISPGPISKTFENSSEASLDISRRSQ